MQGGELENLALWQGGAKLCSTSEVRDSNYHFENCHIVVPAGQTKKISLIADVSLTVPKAAKRKITLGSCRVSRGVSVNAKNTWSSEFIFNQ